MNKRKERQENLKHRKLTSNIIRTYKYFLLDCALEAKVPLIELSPRPKTDQPWSRVHIDFNGPMEIFRCKKATTEVVTSFSHELFTGCGVVDCIVSDNGSQLMSSGYKKSSQTFSVEHITVAPYHLRSKGQGKRFADTFN